MKYWTSWKFIPPSAPHFGGIWEAAVKSFKTHLKRCIGEATLTFEDALWNRGMYELKADDFKALSSDPADPEVLTPGHFLIGRPILRNPEPSYIEERLHNRWELVSQITQSFWKRWSMDYGL
jgi:hypothetical protein